MILYHGTTERNFDQMTRDGFIKPAPQGDEHVSLSRSVSVALYFAEMAAAGSDMQSGSLMILAVDSDAMEARGLRHGEFSSEVWGDGECDWEQEVACLDPIPMEIVTVYHKSENPLGSEGRSGFTPGVSDREAIELWVLSEVYPEKIDNAEVTARIDRKIEEWKGIEPAAKAGRRSLSTPITVN